MKLVKMSLAAAVLLGASAFALDNVKVSGDAKLFYGTDDIGTAGLLDQGSSYADTAIRLGVTGDLIKGVSFGVTGYTVSTLGLEKNLVANTWTAGHDSTAVGDNTWIGEAWLATTVAKTTAKVGRMSLDTPLAFSETWSVTPNTFEAAVAINQDLADTTLVGAWVGNSNGRDAAHTAATGAARDGIMRIGGEFGTFAAKGAYAAAAVNNSLKFLTAQAWYYNVVDVADAYWLQADWDCQLVKGVKLGAQYAALSPKGVGVVVATTNKDTKAFALKAAYTAIPDLTISAAYSDVSGIGQAGGLKAGNVAGSGQSKLYTESFWTYGKVSAPDATSMNLTAEYNAKDIAKFGGYYTSVSNDTASTGDLKELALTASRSFGPLDVTAVVMNTKDTAVQASSYNTVQAYLTLNF
ncbi:MAG: porin [Sulfuricurvum sp.]|nr:porin [Sulfuricurvum sp.]